jgi:hypothetical protein
MSMSIEQLGSYPPQLDEPDPTPRLHAAHGDVALLRWPAQTALRDQLAAQGVPRLLLIAHGCDAPVCVDELEDWAREPLDPVELDARTATLKRRAGHRALRPCIDDAGLVRVGDRWVDLPPVQLAVARLMVARLGRVVSAEQIQAACLDAGGSVHPKAVKATIGRVKSRLAELGLVLANVRDRGYLLEADPTGMAYDAQFGQD